MTWLVIRLRSHNIVPNVLDPQKYSRLRCLLRAKGLVHQSLRLHLLQITAVGGFITIRVVAVLTSNLGMQIVEWQDSKLMSHLD